jgi:[protein-PII] uridylyltransferase
LRWPRFATPRSISSIPRRAASEAPVSEPAHSRAETGPAAVPAFPPAGVVDPAATRRALARAVAGGADSRAIRQGTVAILGAAWREGIDAIAAAFAACPLAARATTDALTALNDFTLREVFGVATGALHPLATPTDSERQTLIATGGYGRGQMAPCSDIDLLFLSPYKLTPRTESVIESTLYMLWDLHLKVGHASRTVRDCLSLGRADMTIRTALLEHRRIAGDAALAQELEDRLWAGLFSHSAPEFIEAKLAETEDRHARQGGQRYVLEPNVKEGKGGLRDLQTLFWIAKYAYRLRDPAELVPHGILTAEEYVRFDRAETFLLAVRCHLHFLAGRPVDQLTFDRQVEVAARMGYADHAGRRAVEHFMQDYFRHATAVGDLTRIILSALEARHLKRAATLTEFLLPRRRRGPKLCQGLELRHGRIAIVDPPGFLDDPVNLLRLFHEALRTGTLLHPEAMRLVAGNLDLADDRLRRDPAANAIFMDMLLNHGNPERALRRMNEVGLLGAFIPEFGRVVAMMQFNMYHHYTVDEHIIQCIAALAALERGEHVADLPVASRILRDGVNRKALYVALLCHDIGKGGDEDHSVAGARIARTLAPRLGLGPEDTETVVWLVRNHLLMSDVAQKRDLTDPRTVRDFARQVASKERLNLLLVLTVCDIRGVGPGTWTNWKAMLLRELYAATARALDEGIEAALGPRDAAGAQRALRAALPDWPAGALAHETARHYPAYWRGLDTAAHASFARLLRGLGTDEIRIALEPDAARGATRAFFALADHPGIFSRLAGALALAGANVVDARTYTSSDGFATAVFWVQDAEDRPYDPDRLPRLRLTIERTLRGEVATGDALHSRDRMKRRERGFRVPTVVTFDNEGSDIYTIVEVETRDRPGLLYDLTRVLAANNVSIVSAVIASYGAQAVDVFYVKDMFGLKLHAQSRRDALERKLREAIAAGAERAAGA